MVRYARNVLKIREQSSFGPKFLGEFVLVFQKDLGWPKILYNNVVKLDVCRGCLQLECIIGNTIHLKSLLMVRVL